MNHVLIGRLDGVDAFDGSMTIVGGTSVENWLHQLIYNKDFKYGDRVEITIKHLQDIKEKDL